jgi:hypothetical protein
MGYSMSPKVQLAEKYIRAETEIHTSKSVEKNMGLSENELSW